MLGFFFDARHAIAANFCDTKSLRIGNFLQEDLGAFSSASGNSPTAWQMLFSMMLSPRITQIGVAAREILGQRQSVRDSALSFLVGVIQMLQPEIAAIPKQAQEVARVLPAGDQQNFMDSGIHKRLNRVIHHGLVIDGQQVFIRDARKRIQPAARSARKHHTFHLCSMDRLDDNCRFRTRLLQESTTGRKYIADV